MICIFPIKMPLLLKRGCIRLNVSVSCLTHLLFVPAIFLENSLLPESSEQNSVDSAPETVLLHFVLSSSPEST